MRAIFSMAMAMLFSFHEAHAEQFLCIEDLSVGFKFDNNTKIWSRINFTADQKFVVRALSNEEFKRYGLLIGDKKFPYNWGVFSLGRSIPEAVCTKSDKPTKHLSGLYCNGGVWGDFNFNDKIDKFEVHYTGNYLDDYNPEAPNSPSLGIGKCSAF